MDSILMEAPPLLKRRLRARVLGRRVPFQHAVAVVEPDGATVRGEHGAGVVEQVVGVDDADVDFLTPIIILIACSGSRSGGGDAIGVVPVDDDALVVMRNAIAALRRAARDLGPDLVDGAQVVEDTAQLVVAGFGRHEVVEAGDGVEGRDRAAVVGRDAGARVAD